MEKIVKLNDDDVVSTNSGFVEANTFTAEEALRELASDSGLCYRSYIQEGFSCKIIGSNTGGWKKGKIRISLEFIAEEAEPPKTPQSPLDDLRQQGNQTKQSRLP